MQQTDQCSNLIMPLLFDLKEKIPARVPTLVETLFSRPHDSQARIQEQREYALSHRWQTSNKPARVRPRCIRSATCGTTVLYMGQLSPQTRPKCIMCSLVRVVLPSNFQLMSLQEHALAAILSQIPLHVSCENGTLLQLTCRVSTCQSATPATHRRVGQNNRKGVKFKA